MPTSIPATAPAPEAPVAAAPSAPAVPESAEAPAKPKKGWVWGARTALVMLFVAAIAVLALGLLALVRNDAPETDGWLRYLFGRVFAVVGFGMAVVLGIPSGIGLWAMTGATKPGNVPALSPTVRQALPALAVGTTAITAVVALTTGRGPLLLDLGLIGIIALATLGLAGAVRFSPHRGRAILSGVTLTIVSLGTLWILLQAFLFRSA
jgi:hypothetical protein